MPLDRASFSWKVSKLENTCLYPLPFRMLSDRSEKIYSEMKRAHHNKIRKSSDCFWTTWLWLWWRRRIACVYWLERIFRMWNYLKKKASQIVYFCDIYIHNSYLHKHAVCGADFASRYATPPGTNEKRRSSKEEL